MFLRVNRNYIDIQKSRGASRHAISIGHHLDDASGVLAFKLSQVVKSLPTHTITKRYLPDFVMCCGGDKGVPKGWSSD